MSDIVDRLRTFAKEWLSSPSNGEIIHGYNNLKITTDDLTQAADEITRLRKANAALVETGTALADACYQLGEDSEYVFKMAHARGEPYDGKQIGKELTAFRQALKEQS